MLSLTVPPLLLLILFEYHTVNGEKMPDLVKKLPGFQELPSKHFSGYIPVGRLSGVDGHLHYWFIESEKDPSSDPIVLWLNGGPGSSSLIGLLVENGQLQLNENSLKNSSDGIPQLFYNPYGWTTIANMLYLESPKGVGFSYCDDHIVDSDCTNTDESTALDAYEFLFNFFNFFPEFKTNKFYITGESYAGIYIPMIMEQIMLDPLAENPTQSKINLQGSTSDVNLQHTTSSSLPSSVYQNIAALGSNFIHVIPDILKYITRNERLRSVVSKKVPDAIKTPYSPINLIGAAIGNGCWGNAVGMCSWGDESAQLFSDFFFGHGMYSQSLRKKVEKGCGLYYNLSTCGYHMDSIFEEIGDFNIYDIYDNCETNFGVRRLRYKHKFQSLQESMRKSKIIVPFESSFTHPAGYGALRDFTCGGLDVMNDWLSHPSVMAALHVRKDKSGMVYNKTVADLRPLYAKLVSKYQMLIYSGDVDACVPYIGTEKWTRELGYEVVDEWHPWWAFPDSFHSLHKAGYAVTFEKSFQFITVNGAGHLVPLTQPGYALAMFQKFLNNTVF